MPDNDIYEISIDQALQGQQISNVQHMQQNGADGTGDAREAVGDLWEAQFKTEFLACLTSDLNLIQLRVRRVYPTETQARIIAVNEPGVDVSTPMPVNSCAMIRFMSATSGRKGTGGTKLTGFSIFDCDDGRVNVSYNAKMQAYANKFVDEYTHISSGFAFHPVVYSRIDNIARDIKLARPLTRVKTIHSRQIGVGQ